MFILHTQYTMYVCMQPIRQPAAALWATVASDWASSGKQHSI